MSDVAAFASELLPYIESMWAFAVVLVIVVGIALWSGDRDLETTAVFGVSSLAAFVMAILLMRLVSNYKPGELVATLIFATVLVTATAMLTYCVAVTGWSQIHHTPVRARNLVIGLCVAGCSPLVLIGWIWVRYGGETCP